MDKNNNLLCRECLEKFGETLGEEIWEKINSVFDSLPLAATINKKIFCCHGGVPPPWLCPSASEINNIPMVIQIPEDQSQLAWNLMWNDPISVSQNEIGSENRLIIQFPTFTEG